MNRNVEIKAKISDPAVMRDRIESMADSAPTLIVQEDIFFNNRRGRLKLRKFSEASGELIYYERPDTF
ncbi:adenylate cyclase, partial [bacterium]|nr:adenylate cyclase [bacterium]